MALAVIVVESFLVYERGDRIEDPDIIAGIRAGENARRVVVVSDAVVPPPPTEAPPSPIAGVLAQLQALATRVAELEARPVGGGTGGNGGGTVDPPPVDVDGSIILDALGRGLLDGQGRYLVA